MMLVFSPLLAPARIFHEIYQRLTQTNDDVIKVRIINDYGVTQQGIGREVGRCLKLKLHDGNIAFRN